MLLCEEHKDLFVFSQPLSTLHFSSELIPDHGGVMGGVGWGIINAFSKSVWFLSCFFVCLHPNQFPLLFFFPICAPPAPTFHPSSSTVSLQRWMYRHAMVHQVELRQGTSSSLKAG